MQPQYRALYYSASRVKNKAVPGHGKVGHGKKVEMVEIYRDQRRQWCLKQRDGRGAQLTTSAEQRALRAQNLMVSHCSRSQMSVDVVDCHLPLPALRAVRHRRS